MEKQKRAIINSKVDNCIDNYVYKKAFSLLLSFFFYQIISFVNLILKKYALHIGWVNALSATTGSLYLSEIMKFPPCILCWYQRIFMFPLVGILAVGIIKKDKNTPLFILPLSIIGMIIALFHYLLQRGVIPDSIAPCIQGISCTTKYIEWFGFVTIPFLSLMAFTIITVCMILAQRKSR